MQYRAFAGDDVSRLIASTMSHVALNGLKGLNTPTQKLPRCTISPQIKKIIVSDYQDKVVRARPCFGAGAGY